MTGKANQPIGVDKYDLLVSQRYVRDLALNNPIPLVILFLAVLIGLLYWFFGTEYGSSLRATGANQNMARAQGIDTKSGITDVYKRQSPFWAPPSPTTLSLWRSRAGRALWAATSPAPPTWLPLTSRLP